MTLPDPPSPDSSPRPLILRGRFVELVPLGLEHVEKLATAASGNRSTFGLTRVPDGIDDARCYVENLLRGAALGEHIAFTQVRVADRQVVGCTRFMELRRWRGRTEPDEVEIGGTWLAESAQRSAINTEAKLLLLTHAFETWGVVRACFCTDVRNTQSRHAIERLGARLDGVLRNHRASMVEGEAGRARDSALYSITDHDWPGIRTRLQRQLDQ
ncbi:MAG: GNAT family N-acetyltransferase [Acidimicrobiales bacterium]|nr:GNAT family N-acetyltransferase [Acidimicrobiales bacterium]